MENYLKIFLPLPEEQNEIAIALLADVGFEAFEETHEGLEAYILESQFDETEFRALLTIFSPDAPPEFERNTMPPKNWNAEWEKNFEAIDVDSFCQVIAPFKTPGPGFQHHLIIQPKMSFGTGHHETTRLMIRQCATLDFRGKSVLDMGCGTGILGVLAAKLGAASVLGIDIDEWSYENAMENISLNGVEGVEILRGDAESIPGTCYDILLANINRNVLLADAATYASHLELQGIIVLSGFLTTDELLINECYQALGFVPMERFQEGDWVSLSFKLNNRKPEQNI